jgi:hypothetical protein
VVGTRADVLLVPVNAIFDQQGTLVAHVVGPSGVDTRRVDVGESNDVLVEVVGGLREGDQVLLTQPGRTGAAPPAPAAGGTRQGAAAGRHLANGLQPR